MHLVQAQQAHALATILTTAVLADTTGSAVHARTLIHIAASAQHVWIRAVLPYFGSFVGVTRGAGRGPMTREWRGHRQGGRDQS